MVCFVSNSKVRGQEVNPFAQQTWLSVKVHLGWIENLISDFKGTAAVANRSGCYEFSSGFVMPLSIFRVHQQSILDRFEGPHRNGRGFEQCIS